MLILSLRFPEVPEEIYLNPDSACDTSGALSGVSAPVAYASCFAPDFRLFCAPPVPSFHHVDFQSTAL
jgi:hypothetical protein